MEIEDLYSDVLLDHYHHPRCKGTLDNPCSKCSMNNPLCGDKVSMTLSVENGKVVDARFDGQGCVISQAGASIAATIASGKSIHELNALIERYRGVMSGKLSVDEAPELGDALALSGVKKFPARIRCALLAFETLDRCLKDLTKCN